MRPLKKLLFASILITSFASCQSSKSACYDFSLKEMNHLESNKLKGLGQCTEFTMAMAKP